MHVIIAKVVAYVVVMKGNPEETKRKPSAKGDNNP
jgi:hypothetical protein